MNLLKKTYLRGILSKEIELLIIFSALLFLPDKSSLSYFLVISALLLVFSLRAVFTERNLSISSFSNLLIIINAFFIITSFFSNNIFNSILLISDILIISLFVFILFTNSLNLNKLFFLLLLTVTIFSSVKVINDMLLKISLESILFDNPIRIGVVSGLGVIIALVMLMKKFSWIYILFLFINLVGVFCSKSKGVFLGIVFIAILFLFQRYKKMILIVVLLVVFTFLISNPIKNRFEFSIGEEKYSAERINIWKMSLEIFQDNPFFGVGPNNFKNVAKNYNFKQTHGPANYFKVPAQTHNDYFKLLVENGLFGFLMIMLLFFGFIRKIKQDKVLNLPELLLLFLLFQSLFFNILFKPFFLFMFIFLLKIIFEKKIVFINLTRSFKLIISSTIIFVFLIGHLLPYLSNNYLNSVRKSGLSFKQKDKYLEKASFFMPINSMPLINRSLLHFKAFTKNFNFDFCFSAMDLIKRAKRFAPDNSEIYNIEIQIFKYYYKPIIEIRKNLKKEIVSLIFLSILNHEYILKDKVYKNIEKLSKNIRRIDPVMSEILELMNKRERVDRNNPFLRFEKARLLLDFDKRELARIELKNALELEPEYLDALILLEHKFDFFKDKEKFKNKIKKIIKKGKSQSLKKGSYLYALYNSTQQKH